MKKVGENRWRDERCRLWQAVPEANEIMCIEDPAPEREYSVEDFSGPVDTEPPDPSVFEAIDYIAEHLCGERYICSKLPITAMPRLGDFDQAMITFATRPDLIQASNRHTFEKQNSRGLFRTGYGRDQRPLHFPGYVPGTLSALS